MVRIRKRRVAALAVPLALAFVAGTALADPVLVEAMGLDVWHVGQLERELRNAIARDKKLDSELQVIIDRAAVHNLMLDDLISGRLALADAARQKWAMNCERDVERDHLERNRIGPTMEAKMAHDLYEMAINRDDGGLPAARKLELRAEYESTYGASLPPDR